MPEVNQLFFTHKEVLELLIKKAKIHEGRWMLSTNFGFAAGNFGPARINCHRALLLQLLGLVFKKRRQKRQKPRHWMRRLSIQGR